MGFVKFRFELINASGQPVLELIVSPMFGRRAGHQSAQNAPRSS
jgi:hypothetical protein